MEDLKEIVSKNIIYLRTNNNLTQLELGEKISYSDKAVSKWERGEAIPDAYVLKKLASLFDVTVDYLLSEHKIKELKRATPHRFNRAVISFIAFLGVWTLALFTFSVLQFNGIMHWLIFIYAIPVSLALILIFNSLWGKKSNNFYIISLIVWGVILSVYLTFLSYNLWLLFIVGIPSQIIIYLSFKVRISNKKSQLHE